MSDKEKYDMFTAMDEMAKAAEMWTGFKQKFISMGWSPEVAELMIYESLKASNIQNQMLLKQAEKGESIE